MRFLLSSCLAASVQAADYTYDYDASGMLLAIRSTSAPAISYEYDSAGNIVRFNPSVLIDSDHDQLPDDWELSNFGNLSQSGSSDFDFDGQTNLDEYRAGTNPKDKQSSLRIVEASMNSGAATLIVQTVAGKSYRIESKRSLEAPSWTAEDTLASTGATLQWRDPGAIQTAKYFRIVLIQ